MLTKTTTALLDGLIDVADDRAWREFDVRYRPILVSFATHLGLSAEDAADAAQEALVRFVREYRAGKYDRQRGRLRSWLIGIAKHCIADLRRNAADRRERRGISALADLPLEDELARLWDAECERAILADGMRELKEDTRIESKTIQAFEMLAIEHRSAGDVAVAMNMSKNDVYLAKHRCLSRLRAIVGRLNEAYEVE